jgi:hypothetical protein
VAVRREAATSELAGTPSEHRVEPLAALTPRDAAAKRQPLLQGEGRVTFACTTLRLNKGTSTYHDNLISVLYDSMTLPGIGPVRRDLDQ